MGSFPPTEGVTVSVDPAASFGWLEGMVAFALIAAVAFLVPWIFTDLLHLPRTAYIAILTIASLGLAGAYLRWSGTSPEELFSSGWRWGVVAGLIAGAVVAPGVRRLPRGPRPHGVGLIGPMIWEGLVYGFAEAVLLATLPVLSIWQGAVAAGWTDRIAGSVAAGCLAVFGALVVVFVHHMGYREFRGSAARTKLVGALAGCGVQALAFLLTGNAFAPIVAHVVLHGQLLVRGVEMPPTAAERTVVEVAEHPDPVRRERASSARP
jgi:hypothetical protein